MRTLLAWHGGCLVRVHEVVVDAVFYSAKRVHLTLSRVGRRLLKAFGLTPARFEMLYVVERVGIETQKELCDALGLARATVCEMLQVLERLGLITRGRSRRTKRVWITSEGERALDAAYGGCIGNGKITLAVDAALTRGDAAVDPDEARNEFLRVDSALRWFFYDPATRGDLYRFDWYENLGYFAWLEDRGWPEDRLPFVDELTSVA